MQITHLQPQPVPSRVYQAIADANSAFEKLAADLQTLQQFSFFPADNLAAWRNMILHIQAHANYRLMECLNRREMNNAAYYERLCTQWERQLRDPDDVLIEAEHRKKELAEQQTQAEES